MPVVDPQDLMGITFLMNKEGGQRLRDRVVKSIYDFEGDLDRHCSRLKFVCTMINDIIEEMSICNESLDHVNISEEEYLIEWRFK